MSADVGAVVLAAGLGTRMKSARPKVLHELGGRPLLSWAVETARQAIDGGRVVVVRRQHRRATRVATSTRWSW